MIINSKKYQNKFGGVNISPIFVVLQISNKTKTNKHEKQN